MTTTTDPVFASKTVSVRTQAITASSSSAGDSVTHTAATSRVEISNRLSPKWPIEYRVGSAAWAEVGEGKSTWLDIDLSTTALKIRRSANAPASVDVVLTFEGVPAGLTAGTGGADVGIFTDSETASIQALVSEYENQAAVWYAGEISSVVTPSITADGDLTSATDQVPLKWLIILNADDDVTAAQALLDGGPNVIEVLPGAQEQPRLYGLDGVTPQIITRIYAVCISSSANPADYTGGAYILSDADTRLASALANMARFDFGSGLGATVARLLATPIYNTHYTQLSVAAGVVA